MKTFGKVLAVLLKGPLSSSGWALGGTNLKILVTSNGSIKMTLS